MKIETQPLEDHQVKLTVEPDLGPFEQAKKNAARRLSKRTKIPGFRPGKAPYPIVARHIGESTVIEEAVKLLIDDIYFKVIDEAGIEPYGLGVLKEIVSIDPPILEFVIPLKAKVELGDYRSLRLTYELKEVTEEEVEAVITDLRELHSVDEPSEKPVQEGNVVTIRLSGERKQVSEDEDSTFIKERSFLMRIKTKDTDIESSNEWPFTGFSRHLIGLSVGDKKNLVHTFSESTQFESLSGVEVQFHIKMEDVKSSSLPELNDDFAQSAGDYADLNELKSSVHLSLENVARQNYNDKYDEKILNEVINMSSIKYPPQMLEGEIKHLIDHLEKRLAGQNLDIDLYLKTRSMDMEALREETRSIAEDTLQKMLVILELSEAEKIQVDPDELKDETNRTIDKISQTLNEKEARKLSDEDMVSTLTSNIRFDILTKRTQERIRDIARGVFVSDDAPPEVEVGVESEAIPNQESKSEDDDEEEPKDESHVDDESAPRRE